MKLASSPQIWNGTQPSIGVGASVFLCCPAMNWQPVHCVAPPPPHTPPPLHPSNPTPQPWVQEKR